MNLNELSSSTEALVHIWSRCDNCHVSPINGRRYHCVTCPAGPDNDLCESCYELLEKRNIRHPKQEEVIPNPGVGKHEFTIHDGQRENIYEPWLRVPDVSISAPEVPHPFVVRPIFYSGKDFAFAGYAFAVGCKDNPALIITALHVLDEMIKKKRIDCTGRNQNYTGKELPALIDRIDLYDVFAANWMTAPLGCAGPMLVLPGSRTEDEEPNSDRDIAAFYVETSTAVRLKPAVLAEHEPRVGDPVWLVAQSPKRPGKGIFKATVVEITNRSMIFIYEKIREGPRYVSGAPVLDRNGEVVGLLVGGGELEGRQLGHANHVGNIRRHLSNSIMSGAAARMTGV